MKKKLKVQKALGGLINRNRPVVQQPVNRGRLINPVRPLVNPAIDRGLVRPGTITNPALINPVRPNMQQPGFGPPQMVPGPDGTPIRNPIFNIINPVRPGMQQQGLQIINGVKQLPDPSTVGSNMVPRPGVTFDPRTRPPLQFASAVRPSMSQPPVMPNPNIGAAQAAPAQPIAAMKKGGYIRGGRAEIKGHRRAKLL